MKPDELVKLEISRCGPQLRDLRLTYIGSDRNKPTNRVLSFQHTHYHYINRARMLNVISDIDSIIFRHCGASGVKLANGRHYTIEFAPGRGYEAHQLTEALSLPEIRLIGTGNGPSAVKFDNSFNRQAWNKAVSDIRSAETSLGHRFFFSEPMDREREFDHKKERKKKTKKKKKKSQKRRSGLFCFC